MALPETFPSERQRVARGRLEYVSCLLSRAEATIPTGACPRSLGDWRRGGANPGPRSPPLYYAATPQPPGSCADMAIIRLLSETDKSAPPLLQNQDSRRRLSILEGGGGDIFTHQMSGDPGPAGVEAIARLADFLALL